MSTLREAMNERLLAAIRHFWSVRERQSTKQGGEEASAKDRGQRGAVTGGKQMDGFMRLVHDLFVEAGLESATIYCLAHPNWAPKKSRRRVRGSAPVEVSVVPVHCGATELPGWFRAEKNWDLLV